MTGLEIAVTGSRTTLLAIRRMIPAWVQMANGHNGWSAKAAELPNGELLTEPPRNWGCGSSLPASSHR